MNWLTCLCDIATLDVKLKAPNGTNVTVKGKQGFDGVTGGSVSAPSLPLPGLGCVLLGM